MLYLRFAALAIAAGLLAACGPAPAQADAPPPVAAADTTDIPRLSPAQTAAALADAPETVVVDVRTPAEVAASGRLAGAVVIDVTAPGFDARALAALDPDQPTILYCRSGARSERAAQRLAALGFSDLANAGGFDALAASGLGTEPYTP